ncbi:hypothetical protein PMZ80_008280 [Knufia obscura]|uniref:Uncharacterized protein n=2 Tax=Knufia TaxID=430999 RepID=A0AAN8EJF6_9EURO|nr:hypothetical protein PMZ80_008280 [Knufia obscura]KAK5956994.1 hypothetical protein OHC33_001363 [Knufia fluminis]
MTPIPQQSPSNTATGEHVPRPPPPPTTAPRAPGHHYSASSSGLATNKSRRSLAALARDKVAGITSIGTNTNTLPLRSTTSSGSLQKRSLATAQQRPNLPRNITSPPATTPQRDLTSAPASPTERPMAAPEKNNSKMHQTSSKILRMTDDDRPFTKDFKDLFSTLITSLPLTAHRVRFQKIEETFLSEEAITNLGSLKFSQSNRIPDPSNPSRWVVTTTTTTFSMAKEMARQVCQRFVDARFIESAEGKTYATFPTKGALWQLTPKGVSILKRFCDRNGIEARHIEPLLRRSTMQIVVLERDAETDKLMQDKTTLEVVFRRMCGVEGPNLKSSTSQSDSDSVSEYASGIVGVKMAKDRRIFDKLVPYTFTGKAASDWLLDCCTMIERREAYELCELFVKWQLMAPALEDRNFTRQVPAATHFQPTKYAIYAVTEKGQRVCGWLARPPSMSSEDSSEAGKEKKGLRMPKDTNMNRFNTIMHDAALRMLFREHLRSSLCEENLTFWLDVHEFLNMYRTQEKNGRLDKPEIVRECLATAYGLYNSYLAAGAPSELNIDHSLRNRLDGRMTQTETDEESMRCGLQKVVELIELASMSVAKLMASDSVPKFLRDPKYQNIIREHQIDMNLAQRSLSPAPSPGQNDRPSLSRSNTNRLAKS